MNNFDLGWFTVLAKPMLHALKFYGYIPNFGVGIIIITVILKILFPDSKLQVHEGHVQDSAQNGGAQGEV